MKALAAVGVLIAGITVVIVEPNTLIRVLAFAATALLAAYTMSDP